MSAPITAARLAEIRARAEAATVGEWHSVAGPPGNLPEDRPITSAPGRTVFVRIGDGHRVVAAYTHDDATGAFIAAARSDVPNLADALLEAVRLLRDQHTLAIGTHLALYDPTCRACVFLRRYDGGAAC